MSATFAVDISVFERGRRKPEYSLDSDLTGEMTLQELLEWTKTALIVTADEVLKDEQSLGFDKDPIMLVDGRRNRDIRTVSPLGRIDFIARQEVGDVLIDAYKGVLNRSKVLTGRYKGSHYVFHNGAQIATSLRELEVWFAFKTVEIKDKDTFRIVNIQPYARKLELLGVTAQRTNKKTEDKGRRKGIKTGQVFKVPNGAYQLTTRSIKSKYKQNVLIRFSFLSGSSLGLAGTFKSGRKGKNSAGRPYLYPSIIITIQERGTIT